MGRHRQRRDRHADVAPGATLTTTGYSGFERFAYTFGGIVGVDEGSTGTVIISGAGAVWTDESDFVVVGQAGRGTLQLSAGGVWNTQNVTVGAEETGNGTITVSGAGTQWNNAYTTIIGANGTGNVTVSGGAQVNNDEGLYIGGGSMPTLRRLAPETGNGSLTITGAGSTWFNKNGVNIARNPGSTGSLTVENGGSFQTYEGSLYAGLGATITVTGPGSSMLIGTRNATPPVDWSDGDGWFSPDEGATTVISNGATLDADASYIGGGGTDAVTSITVTGAGTTWRNWLNIYVGGTGNGDPGRGSAIVADGAVATSYTGAVGVDEGSSGTLLVTGPGTVFQVLARTGFSGNFRVGFAGDATVTVQDGATLSAANLIRIADLEGSVGTLNIGAAEGQAPVAPGTVVGANGVYFGEGDATLVFNHPTQPISIPLDHATTN